MTTSIRLSRKMYDLVLSRIGCHWDVPMCWLISPEGIVYKALN